MAMPDRGTPCSRETLQHDHSMFKHVVKIRLKKTCDIHLIESYNQTLVIYILSNPIRLLHETPDTNFLLFGSYGWGMLGIGSACSLYFCSRFYRVWFPHTSKTFKPEAWGAEPLWPLNNNALSEGKKHCKCNCQIQFSFVYIKNIHTKLKSQHYHLLMG